LLSVIFVHDRHVDRSVREIDDYHTSAIPAGVTMTLPRDQEIADHFNRNPFPARSSEKSVVVS
jgi:hypothetical protein